MNNEQPTLLHLHPLTHVEWQEGFINMQGDDWDDVPLLPWEEMQALIDFHIASSPEYTPRRPKKRCSDAKSE